MYAVIMLRSLWWGGGDELQVFGQFLESMRCKIQKIGNPKRNLYHNNLSHTNCLYMHNSSFKSIFGWFFSNVLCNFQILYNTAPPPAPPPLDKMLL
jgi:hypothetical protein